MHSCGFKDEGLGIKEEGWGLAPCSGRPNATTAPCPLAALSSKSTKKKRRLSPTPANSKRRRVRPSMSRDARWGAVLWTECRMESRSGIVTSWPSNSANLSTHSLTQSRRWTTCSHTTSETQSQSLMEETETTFARRAACSGTQSQVQTCRTPSRQRTSCTLGKTVRPAVSAQE